MLSLSAVAKLISAATLMALSVSAASAQQHADHNVNRAAKAGFLSENDLQGIEAPAIPILKLNSANIADPASVEAIGAKAVGTAVRKIGNALETIVNGGKGAENSKTGAKSPLASFHKALWDLETGARKTPLTILHLGDEHIAFDKFSSAMRDRMHVRFGDAGRGMLLPAFPFPYYRAKGIKFSQTGKWQASTIVNPGNEETFGLSGSALTSLERGSKLTLEQKQGSFDWAEVTFRISSKKGWAIITVDGPNGPVNKVFSPVSSKEKIARIKIDHPGNKVTVQQDGEGPITVLSWQTGKNRPGIRYVNIGIPSATADSLVYIDRKLLADELRKLNPDLIIASYGAADSLDLNVNPAMFANQLSSFLRSVKQAVPHASMVITGSPDSAILPAYATARLGVQADAACRSLTKDERGSYQALLTAQSPRLARWHPPLKSADLNKSKKIVAAEQAAHYWDWSTAMGGPCSIHGWVHTSPALATPDHQRLTEAGSALSADAFYNDLMKSYTQGQIAKNIPQ